MAKESADWRSALEVLKNLLPQDAPGDTAAEAPDVTAPQHAPQIDCLDIVLDRKGRKGKSATIISGFTIPDSEIESLAAGLKRSLGTGGSVRGGEILIQGDRRDDVLRFLSSRSFKARILG